MCLTQPAITVRLLKKFRPFTFVWIAATLFCATRSQPPELQSRVARWLLVLLWRDPSTSKPALPLLARGGMLESAKGDVGSFRIEGIFVQRTSRNVEFGTPFDLPLREHIFCKLMVTFCLIRAGSGDYWPSTTPLLGIKTPSSERFRKLAFLVLTLISAWEAEKIFYLFIDTLIDVFIYLVIYKDM